MLASQGGFDTAVAAYVHNAAVDIAKLFEAKEPGSVCGIIEDVGLSACEVNFHTTVMELTNRRRIDGHGTGVCRRIRLLTAKVELDQLQ